MLRFIAKRIGYSVLVLLGVSIVTFMIIHLAPGNPARLLLPQGATDEQVREKEVEMGLDRPLLEQYTTYMGNVLKGNFGTSFSYSRLNSELIAARMPVTIKLTLSAVLVSLCISLPMGILAGIKKGTAVDLFAMVFALLGQAISPVWMGFMLILIFAVILGWLPAMGTGTISHLILPSITLGTPLAALVTRMTRAGMIDIMQEDYITATYAKGLPEYKIITKYAMKNALIPVVTVVGIQIGTFLGGAIVTEQIFALPGIGSLCLLAINNRDFPLVQSIMLIISAMFVFVNLCVDIIYTLIDPRLAVSSGK